MITRWRVGLAGVRGIPVVLSVATDDEDALRLVESAAAAHGVHLERMEPPDDPEPSERPSSPLAPLSRDRPVRVEHLVVGDELLVDGRCYGADVEWCRLERVAPGSAAVYPYKVTHSNGAPGQYSAREILGARRPEWLEEAIAETDAIHPGHREALEASARWPR